MSADAPLPVVYTNGKCSLDETAERKRPFSLMTSVFKLMPFHDTQFMDFPCNLC